MQTAIGHCLRHQPRMRWLALVAGVTIVSLDLLFERRGVQVHNRGALAVVALALFVYITNGDCASLGLRLSPKQGWLPWARITLAVSVAMAACIGIGFGAWHLLGLPLPILATPPDEFIRHFLHMSFFSPTVEETIYRVAVCVPLVPLIGCWKTIAINGILFAALHFVYGNPSPENLVGGFFLAWVYLKSDSIVLPFLMHAAGNLLALLAQIAAW